MNEVFSHYLTRHAAGKPVLSKPLDGCAMVVVIPVHNEPDLALTIASLAQCTPPNCRWMALLVVNDCIGDPPEIVQQNRATITQWQANPSPSVAIIDATAQPDNRRGVGNARKIGMDAAIAAFDQAGHDGILLSLDGDCTVNVDYLIALHDYFLQHPQSPACVTSFCHPLDATPDATTRAAIVQYELHLRYYQLGLQAAKVPYAFTTIGSCFACRASDYARQGGMNRRQAGEDFYFLHKMAQRGAVGHCRKAVVYPSPRVSRRTPFGTGQAMATWLEGSQTSWSSYHPQAFIDLAVMVDQIDAMYDPNHSVHLPPSMQDFFQQQDGAAHLTDIRCNTASQVAFHKRFWHWFDGFLAMKFIRFACNNYHHWMPVEQGLANLLHGSIATNNAEALLSSLRSQLQKSW
ncbi:MAG: glycosyltransferase family A protein [Mariprofundales bacterium]